MNGSSLPAAASNEARMNSSPGLVGEQRVVDASRRHAREARRGAGPRSSGCGRGHRDRVAVAAEPAGEPQHVDRLPPSGARVTADPLLDGPHQRRPCARLRRQRSTRPRRSRSTSASSWCSRVPCRWKSSAVPGDEARLREPLERVRDRRTLGRHELTEQPVGERQRQADPARLDPPPARRQMPEQQTSRTSSRGCDVIARSTSRSSARRPARRSSAWIDLRPRPHPVGELGVEHREPRRRTAPPAARAREQLVGLRGSAPLRAGRPGRPARPRCGRRPGSRARAGHRGSAAPGPCPAASNHGARSHLADPGVEHADAVAAGARRPAHRTSNSSASSPSGVEQVACRGVDSAPGSAGWRPTADARRRSWSVFGPRQPCDLLWSPGRAVRPRGESTPRRARCRRSPRTPDAGNPAYRHQGYVGPTCLGRRWYTGWRVARADECCGFA